MSLFIQRTMNRASKALEKGELNEAERLYRDILEKYPKHPGTNHCMGIMRLSTNNVPAALPFLRIALESESTRSKYWNIYAKLLTRYERYKNAIQAVGQANQESIPADILEQFESHLTRKKRSDNVATINEPAESINELLCDFNNSEFELAEKKARLLIMNHPSHNFAYKILGAIYEKTNRKHEALQIKQKTVELFPSEFEAHYNLANAYKDFERFNEAEVSYSQAIALNPESAMAYNNLALALKNNGKIQEAAEQLYRAIEIKHDYGDAYYNLANILAELKRYNDSEKCYRLSIKHSSNNARAYNNLGNLLKERGKIEEAIACYTSAINSQDNYADAHYNLGNVFLALKRWDDAETSYKNAIVLDPKLAHAYSNLGMVLKSRKRLSSAEEKHRKAIELNPNVAEFYNNLGVTLKALNKLEESENCFDKALLLKPSYGEASTNRWVLLFESGQYEKALIDADKSSSKVDKAFDLISLLALGRKEEIYKRLQNRAQSEYESIGIAAFASFFANIEKKSNANKFCPDPYAFIKILNLSSDITEPKSFIDTLLQELSLVNTEWEPRGKATNGGSQTLIGENLFNNNYKNLTRLRSYILSAIEIYKSEHRNSDCTFIKKWPISWDLYGWHVVLRKQGYQDSHIHQTGWLSGVIYLKVITTHNTDEGAIEFDLSSKYYSSVEAKKIIYNPKIGDVVLFPSSLHHRTIPFNADDERIVIAFDLMPR